LSWSSASTGALADAAGRTLASYTLAVDDRRSRRRYVVLAEGRFGDIASKTALGVIRYGRDPVVAVLDSTQAGRNVRDWLGPPYDIPVLATLDDALRFSPTALLIGIAPPGGRLPAPWRATILDAIEGGLDVVSGLHEFLSDDPEFTAAAATRGVALIDHRRVPERFEVATGRAHLPGRRVVLTVGTDCAIGKMTVALELRRAARSAGLRAVFVPTGQTGIMIEGWGVSVDRVIGDFVQGAVEWLVEQAEGMGDWIFVEGQGSLDHPSYSSVTLALVHGATPHAMVLVHEPGRVVHHGWEDRPGHHSSIKPLRTSIEAYELVAGLVAPSRVAAIALDTSRLRESEARREIARAADETGITADDPVRFGGERLLDALRDGLED
jgi:uncharacterized NAD-dependent epimerase/dehydratase family protein